MLQLLLSPRFAIVLGGVLLTGIFVYNHRAPDNLQSAPASFSLAVPFTTQAPDGVWENNANCEEASSIMANAYLTGNDQDELPAPEVKQSLAQLVNWEQSNLGHSIDTGVSEIGRMIEENFHLSTRELADFTADGLKKELLENHVLILPVNLKLLGNTKYQGAGADYHVIVIRGYTETGFIVNDAGTTSGKNNSYAFATLHDASADWDSVSQKLNPNKKVILVVSK